MRSWSSSQWTTSSSAPRFARPRNRPAWSWPLPARRQEILDQARTLRPPLVIFDLNSAKTDPIATIAAMKSDPALASIRTLGFVSHVDSDTISGGARSGHRSGHGALGVCGAARGNPPRRRDPARPDRRRRYPRRGREDSRPYVAHAPACIGLALRDWRRPGAAQARNPPADVLVQDPRRVQRRTPPRRACWRSPRPGHGIGRQPRSRARPRRADVRHAADRLRIRRRTGGQARGDARRGCGPAPVPGLRRGRAAGEGTCRRGRGDLRLAVRASRRHRRRRDGRPRDCRRVAGRRHHRGRGRRRRPDQRPRDRRARLRPDDRSCGCRGRSVGTVHRQPRRGADRRDRRPSRRWQTASPETSIRPRRRSTSCDRTSIGSCASARRTCDRQSAASSVRSAWSWKARERPVWPRCSRGGWIPGDGMSPSCCPAPISTRRCCAICSWIRTRIRRRRESEFTIT